LPTLRAGSKLSMRIAALVPFRNACFLQGGL
jgi:hypothetical protein